jgi:hypothetical protein
MSLIASAAGRALAACPRRRRFAAARRLARAVHPLVRRTAFYKTRTRLDGYREDALRLAIHTMGRLGVEFDPIVTVRGAEAVGAGGAIVISGHFLLNGMFLRWLYERGSRVSVLMAQAPDRPKVIIGTRVPLEVLLPDPMVLVRVRRRVTAGGVVLMDIDALEPGEGRHRVDTPMGPRYVSDAVMRFAERAKLPILFCATRVARGGEVVVSVARPTSSCAASVLREFCHFLVAEARQVER